jgi:hypothetical protein
MSVLATILGTYAVGHTLTHDGEDYTFGRIDQAAKAALTAAYFKRAREAVYALRDELDDGEFDRALGRVTDAYRRGDFSFPRGETRGYYLGAGLPELVALLTGRPAAEAAALVEARTLEAFHVCLCVFFESFPEDKKKALQTPDSPELAAVVDLLKPAANGRANTKPSPPPPSPTPASAPATTPG